MTPGFFGKELCIVALESKTEIMTKEMSKNAKQVIDRWDDVFGALTSEPSRQLIVSLLDAPPDGLVSLPDCAINPNVPVDRDELYLELYHRHLPTLEANGFIEWNRDRKTVTRWPRFEEVAVVFRALHARAGDIPDSLVIGCRRLERERRSEQGGTATRPCG